MAHTTRTEYDAVSNIAVCYDAFNKKIAEIIYDEVHNPRTIKDALGNTTTNEYNNLNRLSKTTNPLGDITEYGYDDLNRLNHTIDPSSLEASQEFDEDGNRKKLINPDANCLKPYL